MIRRSIQWLFVVVSACANVERDEHTRQQGPTIQVARVGDGGSFSSDELSLDGGLPDAGAEIDGGIARKPRTGRLVRRLSVDQIRSTLAELTGFTYIGTAVVIDPDSVTGISRREDADLLDVSAAVLGRPDYDLTVNENLEPGVSFSKLVEDAARYVCGKVAQKEVANRQPLNPPRLLVAAEPEDRWDSRFPEQQARIRNNLVMLVRRFWGVSMRPDSLEVTALAGVFAQAQNAPAWTSRSGTQMPAGNSTQGWRSVCIALATDPQFYIY